MTIWGKLLGGVTGFAIGGPIGALVGAAFGHAYDKKYQKSLAGQSSDAIQTRQTAFAIGVIVLSAKMAKADGNVTRDEIDVFKKIFSIPEHEMNDVGRLFDEARESSEGFEPYAQQIGVLFSNEPEIVENLLGGLFQIALADGILHPDELIYLKNVSDCFRLESDVFERIRLLHLGDTDSDPYKIIGVSPSAPTNEIKAVYRTLTRENHPDRIIAKGMPQEFIDIANEKMAKINDAYDKIKKQRDL